MGVGPNVKLTLQNVVQGHIASMRRYADELEEQPSSLKRRDVVNRVLKCADELEAAAHVFEKVA